MPRYPFKQTTLGTVSVLLLAAGLTACNEPANTSAPNTSTQGAKSEAQNTGSLVLRGRELFVTNCAVCHGENAQGAPNWTQRGPDGKLPAPPLNGTGHAWHHPKQALIYTIKNGTIPLGGSMPAWKDKLSNEDIEAIIAWFQSLWPQEIYSAWERIDREAQMKSR